MFTLQILDAGQTFLHPLGGEPAVLGSGETATLRLREAGVDAEHARLEPGAGGYRLIANGEVRVNGQRVAEAPLQLGDRIEIGRAVLVVGRTVARPAQPDDVLRGGLGRRGRVAERSRWSKLLPLVAATGLAGVVVWFVLDGDGQSGARADLAYVARLRENARLDDARQMIARLSREWDGATDDRLARLRAEQQALDDIDAERSRLAERVRDPADTRSYGEWLRDLQRIEQSGASTERIAARLVRSSLREVLLERDARAARAPAPAGVADAAPPRAPGPAAPSAGTAAALAPPPDASASLTGDAAAPRLDPSAVERLCADGLFAQALASIQAGFEQANDPAAVAAWRALEQSVRGRADTALGELLAAANKAAADGGPAAAVALLQAARHRFPATAAFAGLASELQRFRAAIETPEAASAAIGTGAALPAAAAPESEAAAAPRAAAGEPEALAQLADLRQHLDAVRDAEERGDFAAASRQLREVAAAVRARDADYADRLVARADEAELLAHWHDAVAGALSDGRVLTATTVAAGSVTLERVAGGGFVGRAVDGERTLTWHDVDAAGVLALVRQVAATGRSALGAASLLYRLGEAAAAERLLADALKRDAALQPAIDRVLARGRGEPAGEFGYQLRDGQFVSGRALEVEERKKQLSPKLSAALRAKESKARDEFVTTALAQGRLEAEALLAALRSEHEQRRAKLAEGSLQKQLDKLAAARQQLDEARRFAKELIYDEVRYFYPYKPPAVSGEKFAEYNRVQKEVDARVDMLHDLWQADRLNVRVPATLAGDLDRLQWLEAQIGRLGGFGTQAAPPPVAREFPLLAGLPASGSVGLQDFCLDAAERRMHDEWRRVQAYNAAIGKQLSAEQRELLRITNDYRLMFGHRPLAAVPTCCAASQGHADEMSRLGYFSHTSPTPGRTTPYDRMRLAGYTFGVSENIAMTGGALAAHVAWCHSSGHHRNLLDPSHTEIGLGVNGRYYVQNFGSGDVHRTDPNWLGHETR